jgi:hypothetical protein
VQRARTSNWLSTKRPGRQITLAFGVVYNQFIILRNKPGAGYITITSSDPTKIPPPGTRVTPATARNLPKLFPAIIKSTIATDAGAHHWRLVGLEVGTPPNTYIDTIISLGTAGHTALSALPYEIELDRVYIHGDPNRGSRRGVLVNSRATVIKNSYFTNIMSNYGESQAICGWNGPGPFTIENNYLEAAGENIMFGGALPKIANMVPPTS